METDIVYKLKEKGNEAFKKGKLNEALDCYQQAIKMEESLSKDFNNLAILQSNSAQVYLKQEKFNQAISAASISLEYDPGFKKSLFRRGIAHLGLDKKEEATNDLRAVLRMEPKNKEAVSYLRKVFSFAKLSDGLRKALIGHYLRRALINRPPISNSCFCDPLFVKYWLRPMVISLESGQAIKDLLKDGRVGSPRQGLYVFTLASWFVVKQKKADIHHKNLMIILSKPTIMFIIQSIGPTGLSLELGTSLSGLELYPLYEFDKVYCYSNFFSNESVPINEFNRVSKCLTNLAYYDGVPSISMPKLHSLIVFDTRTVSNKFVKDWAKFKWPIKRLEFRSQVLDLTGFSNFKGIVSHDLTDLYMASDYTSDWETNVFSKMIKQLTVLKRCFPNLKNLVVTLEFVLKFDISELLSGFVKSYLKFLANMFDTKKIDWCDKPKICAKFVSGEESHSGILKNMKAIEEKVNECRDEMKELTSIRFIGPSINKLGLINNPCAYARIEMEAKEVWVDLSFY